MHAAGRRAVGAAAVLVLALSGALAAVGSGALPVAPGRAPAEGTAMSPGDVAAGAPPAGAPLSGAGAGPAAGVSMQALPPLHPLHLQRVPPPGSDGPPPDLAGIWFADASRGLGTTGSGGIYATDDAGVSWREVFRLPRGSLGSVVITGDGRLVVPGERPDPAQPKGSWQPLLLHSADGGQHWQVTASELPEPPLGEAYRRWGIRFIPLGDFRFAFTTSQVGYAVLLPDENVSEYARAGLNRLLLATGDGGRHWRWLPLPEGYRSTGGIAFRDARHGLITAAGPKAPGVILATADGGESWRQVYAADAPLYALQAVGAQDLYAAGGNVHKWGLLPRSLLLRSHDGGATWQEVSRQGENGWEIRSLHFTGPDVGWATTGLCGSLGGNSPCYGPLEFTRDGGRTWQVVADYVGAVSALVESAWYVGLPKFVLGRGEHAVLFHTIDGGINWRAYFQPAALYVLRVRFTDSSLGWLETNAGFYLTADGGAAWRRVQLGPPVQPEFDDILFLDPQTALAWHGNGLWRSADGGRTWRQADLPPPSGERGHPSFVSARDGWQTATAGVWAAAIGGEMGSVVRTSADGGRGWTARDFGRDVRLNAVSLAAGGDLWLAGSLTSGFQALLLHSPDGGATWQAYASADQEQLTQAQFVSPRDGWLITWPDGLLLATHDGGQSWKQVWPALQDGLARRPASLWRRPQRAAGPQAKSR